MRCLNTLLLGGGGREHAIAESLSRSGAVGRLHCAPGNPGMKAVETHDADPTDTAAVLEICREHDIGLVVCGPEAPLVMGVGDALRAHGILFFGPGRVGAALEGSKIFAKDFMHRHDIPTSDFDVCLTVAECRAAIRLRRPPYVIKADGLAAGKGVFLPREEAEAVSICERLIEGGELGEAGHRLIIEDYAPGRELTLFAVTDGTSWRLLAPSRDHKRALDGDEGPNTGGMGAYAPVTLPEGLVDSAVSRVLEPTLAGLREDGIEYQGVLYMGLMISPSGDLSVIEYNVRLGDPETQAVLPVYGGDFGELVLATALGDLASAPDAPAAVRSAVAVVLASGGYPGKYETGLPIEGLDGDDEGTFVFHAGTRIDADGRVVTAGGRVLSVVGTGADFEEARRRAYARAARISFANMHLRGDIGWSETTAGR